MKKEHRVGKKKKKKGLKGRSFYLHIDKVGGARGRRAPGAGGGAGFRDCWRVKTQLESHCVEVVLGS